MLSKLFPPITALSLAVVFSFCASESTTVPASAALPGAELARAYCSACHHYPEPDLLDRKTWERYVLPRMGHFMGIYTNAQQRDTLIEAGRAEALIRAAQIFPAEPTIEAADWQAIQAFYLALAPERLVVDSLVTEPGAPFKARFPNLFFSPPSTTLLAVEGEQLFFADANKQNLVQLNGELEALRQAEIGEGTVQLHREDNQLWLTVMGSFSPTDNPLGYIYRLSTDPQRPSAVVIRNLQRPVHASYADWNGDGRTDILICEYGKWTGALSMWWQRADGTYERQDLVKRPGAIRTAVLDINADGRQDFIALFGQGREGIELWLNEGAGKFEQREIVRLSPSHGSSAFDLVDFDGDGRQDIVYTAGDNADFPPLLKPYHGVYVYLQRADFRFQQAHFLPLPGAYRALPHDYDGDGDLDLAAISFFPDYDGQALDFVYFDNRGDTFVAQTLDLKQIGRWLVMERGDLDGDGDEDLVLGSLTFEAPQRPQLLDRWVQQGVPLVLLENQN